MTQNTEKIIFWGIAAALMAFVGFAITYWIFDASRETSMAIGTGFFGGGVAEILLELWKNRYGGRNKRRHPKLDEE